LDHYGCEKKIGKYKKENGIKTTDNEQEKKYKEVISRQEDKSAGKGDYFSCHPCFWDIVSA
jgi:hypothetical protein